MKFRGLINIGKDLKTKAESKVGKLSEIPTKVKGHAHKAKEFVLYGSDGEPSQSDKAREGKYTKQESLYGSG